MADLIDVDEYDDVPLSQRLRLSIVYRKVWADSRSPDTVQSHYDMGFFIGDTPIFAAAMYGDGRYLTRRDLSPGYFTGEDDDCGLLQCLTALITDGTPFDYDNWPDPTFRIIGACQLISDARPGPDDDEAFSLIAIIQWGGGWHGPAMGGTGPALHFLVTRAELKTLRDDLLREATAESICTPDARDTLLKRFAAS